MASRSFSVVPVRARAYTPAYSLESLNGAAVKIADQCSRAADRLNGGCQVQDVLDTVNILKRGKSNIDQYKDTPGLTEYAQQQYNDPAYDVLAAYNSLLSLMQEANIEARSIVPKDENGNILAYTDVAGDAVPVMLDGATTAALVIDLQNINNAVQ